MPILEFNGESHSLGAGKTVLESLDPGGHEISNSCRSGVCHSCMMRATSGAVPAAAQKGLKEAHRVRNYFIKEARRKRLPRHYR